MVSSNHIVGLSKNHPLKLPLPLSGMAVQRAKDESRTFNGLVVEALRMYCSQPLAPIYQAIKDKQQ